MAGRENTCADLSRIPKQLERESISVDQINAINSHRIEKGLSADDVTCDASNGTGQHHLIELVGEYLIDEEIRTLKEAIEAGKVTEACASRYQVQDDRL